MTAAPHRKHYLSEWRDYAGLTQLEAADRLGISEGHLSNIENFKRQYTQRLLERAAEVYGCQPADLLSVNPFNPDGGTLLRAATSVPKEVRDTATRMLHSLRQPAGVPYEQQPAETPGRTRRRRR